MIIIFSETYDSMTDRVCMWLQHINEPFIRLNHNARNRVSEVFYSTNDNDVCFVIDNKKEVLISNIKSVWFRRGKFIMPENTNFQDYYEISPVLYNHIKSEYKTTSYAINYLLYQNVFSIGNPMKQRLNKIIVLETAKKVGLMIPNSVIAESRNRVKSCFGEKELMSKNIDDLLEIEFSGKKFHYRNKSFKTVKDIPRSFSYSIFQEKVDTKLEIRAFYLMGKTYSIAQKYNSEMKRGCWYKYSLTADLEDKIHLLMKMINLNSGSIDFLMDKRNNFFFLEVNPEGQFEWVSDFGNYQLDKIIAQKLANGK